MPRAPSIISAQSVSPHMRARDLRDYINQYGTEQGITLALERILDEMAGSRQAMREMTEMLDKVMDHLGQLHIVAGSMKDQIDHLKRLTNDDETPSIIPPRN